MTLRTYLSTHPTALKLWDGMGAFFANIQWPRVQALFNGGVYFYLKECDHDHIRGLLKENYLIILTRRKSHLTTYIIFVLNYLYTRKKPYYTHTFMNVEGDIQNNMDYKIIEATAKGVHYSTFMQVFDCDSVVLLKPKDVPLDEWTTVLDNVKGQLGYPYDNIFDITTKGSVTCAEMVYQGLLSLPNYRERFPRLLALLEAEDNNLAPQNFYECGDFDIVYENRR